MCFYCSIFFFFFKQKTSYEMRISDWSSDVCSSDLFVAMGDTVSWEVAPADNSLFVKPRERAGATNLIVVTDFQGTMLNYTSVLSTVAAARSPGTFFKVRLRYPAYVAAKPRLAQYPALLAPVTDAQLTLTWIALD